MAVSRSFCSAAALSVPAGPCGIPSSARVDASVSGSALSCGNGDESSPVPTEPNAARFAGVSGTRISVPSSDPAFSGLFLPMMTARQSRSSCSRHDARSTMSRSSSSGSGPSAFRQSPSARADAGTHGRAHGTSARSPASAVTASRMPAPGISVISTITRIMNALASSRSRSPFTNSGRSTARSAIPSITPGPAFVLQPFLQRPQRRVMHRAALRLHPPVPPDLRRRDRHHLAEHHRVAGADLLRPPDDQRRPVPVPQRPAVPQRRRQVRQPHRHHQHPPPGTSPSSAVLAGSTRRNRVDIHKRLL